MYWSVVNLDCLGNFDLLQSIARLADTLNAATPQLNDSGLLDIKDGRSPALLLHLSEAQDVVPFSISLSDAARLVVITGPNAGGKTVTMKAIGLLSVMIAYEIPVPVDPQSDMSLFLRIMVEIGDNQSIEHDLSTYSARMKGLSVMVEHAGPGTLILIDEIGTGTDPAECAVLVQAVLEKFITADARTVVTTHHGTLKVFAHNAAGAQNGSMEFDHTSLKPTFKFRQGIPGSSYAFLIAERLKLAQDVLVRARALMGEAAQSLENLLLALQKQKKGRAAEASGIRR